MDKDTGCIDSLCRKVYEGDVFNIPEHEGECCNHFVRVVVKWNKEWDFWGLVSESGKWFGLKIVQGYSKES